MRNTFQHLASGGLHGFCSWNGTLLEYNYVIPIILHVLQKCIDNNYLGA